jgi:glycosyltransferase involved in cell wall biosynthesis
MTRILIVTDNLPEQVNGVVTTFRQIETLARSDGYDVVYLDPRQFRHAPAPGYPEVRISWPWGIGRRITEIAPDHVHIATEGPIGLAARLWLDRQGWRYNTSYHTKFPEFVRRLYSIPESWTYAYLRWFHKHSGRVLTTTETMVKELKDHGFQGEILSWTRGVDRDYLMPSHTSRPNTDRVRLLYVGRVSKEKNLDDLCCLQDQFEVTIVGDGPYLDNLRRRYPRVRFAGYLHGPQLADAYAAADVFVFPSCADTFGIVMIEAISLGTPVAAYPVAGPIDVVTPGVNGWLGSDLVDCIQRCRSLDRAAVAQSSTQWTWNRCWQIFRDNLVSV